MSVREGGLRRREVSVKVKRKQTRSDAVPLGSKASVSE